MKNIKKALLSDEMKRINGVKPSEPNTHSNGAASIQTPPADGNVNHGTQIEPQQIQGSNILEKSDFHENYKKGHYNLFWSTTFQNGIVKPRKPFTKFEAWMWMLSETCIDENGDDREINFGGKDRKIRIEYGQFCHSERFMSEAFGWSKTKIRTFIEHLSSTSSPMITRKLNQQIQVITVCNFWEYQNPRLAKETGKRPARDQQETSKRPNYNTKTLKQINKYTPAFERFWNWYDKKSGKKQTFVEWKKKRIEKNGLLETVFLALEKGVHLQKSGGDPQKVKDPERWIKYECYNDEPFKKKEQTFV